VFVFGFKQSNLGYLFTNMFWTVSDTSRLERVDSDKEGTSSDVHLMRHASKNTQNLVEEMMPLSQVS